MTTLSRLLFSKSWISLGVGNRVFSARNFHSVASRVGGVVGTSGQEKGGSVVPCRASSHGNHVQLWTAEKILSGALIPVIPLAFMFPCNAMDYLLAFSLTLHGHWGIEAIVVDYVRPSIFGEIIPKLSVGMVYALSFLTLGGLCYFTYTDVGLVNAIKMLWKL